MKVYKLILIGFLLSLNPAYAGEMLGEFKCTVTVVNNEDQIGDHAVEKDINIIVSEDDLLTLKDKQTFVSEDFLGVEFDGEIQVEISFDPSVENPHLVAKDPELAYLQISFEDSDRTWNSLSVSSLYGFSAVLLTLDGHPQLRATSMSCGLYAR